MAFVEGLSGPLLLSRFAPVGPDRLLLVPQKALNGFADR
jgi:hypothetical protein